MRVTLDVPALVSELRRKMQLTQEELARELDVTFGTINGWEKGRHRPIAAFRRKLLEHARRAGIDTLLFEDTVLVAREKRGKR